jgi:hypothetical protein
MLDAGELAQFDPARNQTPDVLGYDLCFLQDDLGSKVGKTPLTKVLLMKYSLLPILSFSVPFCHTSGTKGHEGLPDRPRRTTVYGEMAGS